MYSPAVRIGNWLEDLELENEKIAIFIRKRENNELLIQQTRRLFDNLLRETRLSRIDGFLEFGSFIQLKAPDMPRSPPTSNPALPHKKNHSSNNDDEDNNNNNDFGLVMSGTIHEKHLGTISNLVNGCRLIASPILVPSARNCFVIKSADCSDRSKQYLHFGQEFILQIADSDREPLYVRAEMPLVDDDHGPLDHNPIVLSNKKDRYCIWKVLHWDKNMRFESEGAPFPPFSRVAIQHLMSGLDMAVEGTAWWLSIFGNECGMSAHTYVNNSKQETAECAWIFVTRKSDGLFSAQRHEDACD